TLNNVAITDSPAGTIDPLSTTTLAPGATVHYTGSYIPSQTGRSEERRVATDGVAACNGGTAKGNASATCRILTAPSIAVTKACVNASGLNAPITFSGTITNTGNVTLDNVSISDSPAATFAALSTTTLAPGATVNYSGSYIPNQTG